jgi:hypothetical protein
MSIETPFHRDRNDVTLGTAGAAASRESMPTDEERDDVGEDSIHSFPASDPPGWISMWAGSPTTDAERPEEVV